MNAVIEPSGQALSERFREPGTMHLSPSRLAEFFGFQGQEVAARAHVHRNTLRLRPHSAQLQKFLRDLLRVVSVASEMTGDPQRAAFLILNEPIRAFSAKTADELLQEGRVEDVIAYLESLDGGAAG